MKGNFKLFLESLEGIDIMLQKDPSSVDGIWDSGLWFLVIDGRPMTKHKYDDDVLRAKVKYKVVEMLKQYNRGFSGVKVGINAKNNYMGDYQVEY